MKKTILFVINTLAQAGAETALISLLSVMDHKKYDISLYVLTGQGEMIDRVPSYVHVLNKDYENISVLSIEGEKRLRKTVVKAALSRGTIFRLMPYLVTNFIHMKLNKKILPDKLLWRLISDGAPRINKTYDLAVAYLEGGSTYYVADHVNARHKAAFLHIDYCLAGYTKALDCGCYECFDNIFTVSDEVTASFCKVYPEYKHKIEVFSNIINRDEIISKSLQPGGFRDDYKGIRILTAARLTTAKAYEISIEAMYILKKNGIKAKWYALGDGDQREMLEDKIKSLGLEDDFILMGAVENPYPYMAQTDLYVHASRFEGKSIAIREAQILGCSIIVSDCSGNREQVDDGVDGRICKLTPNDISDKIIELIENPDQRKIYGQNASKKFQTGKEELQKLLSLINGRVENE